MKSYCAYFLVALTLLLVVLMFPVPPFDGLAILVATAYFCWGWKKSCVILLILSLFWSAFSVLTAWQVAFPYALTLVIFRIFVGPKSHPTRFHLIALLLGFVLAPQIAGNWLIFKSSVFLSALAWQDFLQFIFTILLGLVFVPGLARLIQSWQRRRLRGIKMEQLSLFPQTGDAQRKRSGPRKPFGWG